MPDALAVPFPACMDSTDWPMFRCSSPSSPRVLRDGGGLMRRSSCIARRGQARVLAAIQLEQLGVVEHVVQARGALERGDLTEQILAGARRGDTFDDDLLAGVGQLRGSAARRSARRPAAARRSAPGRVASIRSMTWVVPIACVHSSRKAPADASSPRLASEPLLPRQRGLHDGVEVVEPRAPAEHGADAVGARDQDRADRRRGGALHGSSGGGRPPARRSRALRGRCSRGHSRR